MSSILIIDSLPSLNVVIADDLLVFEAVKTGRVEKEDQRLDNEDL